MKERKKERNILEIKIGGRGVERCSSLEREKVWEREIS